MSVFGGAISTTLAGSPVSLLADRALWMPEPGWLVVADVHLGTEHSFQRAGIALPALALPDDLRRLTTLVEGTGASRLVVLGDLVHRDITPSVNLAVQSWRAGLPGLCSGLTLVRGNHDRQLHPDIAAGWGLDVVEELTLGALLLRHAPEPRPGRYVLGGHVHPVVVLDGPADRLRFPCFHLGEHVGVLPAFGGLTGGRCLPRARGDRLYGVLPGRILEVPRRPGSR